MSAKKRVLVLLPVAVTVVVAAVWFSCGRSVPENSHDVGGGKKRLASSSRNSRRYRRNTLEDGSASARKNKSARAQGNVSMGGGSSGRNHGSERKREKKRFTPEMLERQFKPEDRPIVLAVQSALDRNDFDAVRESVADARRSTSTEVRKHAIESLSWFGAQALPELTGFMADEDSEVAEDALEASEQALSDMEDAKQQFITAAQLMQTFAKNEDAVSSFSSVLTSAGSEIILSDEDQSAADGRETVVGVISEIISLGGQVAEEAKEAYSFITGNDWINVDEAVQWAADPDNYEAPDIE